MSSGDIPAEAFAAEVNLDEKVFTVMANPENAMADTTTNVFLGYIIALAYDRSVWKAPIPTENDLLDCHKLVCDAMNGFNEDFSDHLTELWPILESWRAAQIEYNDNNDSTSTGSTTADSLIESLGSRLFLSSNPDDSKWRLN